MISSPSEAMDTHLLTMLDSEIMQMQKAPYVS